MRNRETNVEEAEKALMNREKLQHLKKKRDVVAFAFFMIFSRLLNLEVWDWFKEPESEIKLWFGTRRVKSEVVYLLKLNCGTGTRAVPNKS